MRRLGAALVELIRRIDATAKFLLIEAAPPELADALVEFWDEGDERLPQLAIASEDPPRFAPFSLGEASAAGLRNVNPGGVCVVVMEGFELAERQSINGFVPVSSGELLDSKNALMLLANAVKPIRRDGPIAAVREALVTFPVGERPSAAQVASYFDAVADGGDPLASLPLLGAFRDGGLDLADVRSERIKENLSLAAARRSDVSVRPAVYSDIRARAQRVLARRDGGEDAVAARFMALLESGSDDVLSLVTFDEAKEILAEGPKGLAGAVRVELRDYRRRTRDEGIPWHEYAAAADALDRAAERKEAARSLLEFDVSESTQVFSPDTRRRLQALLRDRTISATAGSAPEVGIARAIRSLERSPMRLVLVDPRPPAEPSSQSASRDWLTVAVARVRLAQVFRALEAAGCDVDGHLTVEAFGGLDRDNLSDLFTESGLDGSRLPSVKMRLHGPSGSVEVSWTPDADDAALLRCLVEFSETSTLTLAIAAPPEPHRVAGATELMPVDVPDELSSIAHALQQMAADSLRDGLRPNRLRDWVGAWTLAVEEARGFTGGRTGEAASLAGCVEGPSVSRQRVVGMSPIAPIKAEWLADYLESAGTLVAEALRSVAGEGESVIEGLGMDVAAQAITAATASHCPAFIRMTASDEPLLPAEESRIWTVFGGRAGVLNYEEHALDAVDQVLRRLIRLQPEVASHLRCLAIGPGAASLMLREGVRLAGDRVGGVEVSTIEIFAVGAEEPDAVALAEADAHRTGSDAGGRIRLRYIATLDEAAQSLGHGRPAVHFALLTGLTGDGGQPAVSVAEVDVPEHDNEVVFGPRLWQRPDSEQRLILMPPGLTGAALAWLRLAQTIDDRWPAKASTVQVPEMRTGASGAADELRALHELAMWVATLDRYATRDSLERALGDEVAILHQELRLGSDSPLGLVVSQKSGGPVDRAIGRSLRQARIVQDEGAATSLGADLRRVAAQGYGILALEAATSGTGINELVGHVVGFSMLGQTSTPWPLPPGCRVVLVSLDSHPEWFMGQRRADLLALAIDVMEPGVHGAVIEVKARRSDENKAAGEALDQLKKTLLATAFAAYPRPDSLPTRIWLNRIAESLYAVARESRIRLSAEELAAVEQFRRGRSTLEWAGLGLVFGPRLEERRRVHRQVVDSDWVPIAMHDITLTQARLEEAVATDLRSLYTAESEVQPLGGGRQRRRPEAGVPRADRDQPPEAEQSADEGRPQPAPPEVLAPRPASEAAPVSLTSDEFVPPVLGWDQYTGEPIPWRAAGSDGLSNGHVQIWGSSGAGKTQFVKMLLAQLSSSNGAKFGIADFKNDYGTAGAENFPASVGAEFIDMWGRPGASYNPLALDGVDGIDAQVIEFRDSIEQAMASYQRIGQRQKSAIERALRAAYQGAQEEGRWPTMLDLNREVSDDIAHILGDLTRYEIFAYGSPLSVVVDRNVVFGLNLIPGNGQTTVLAAAFLLSVVAVTMQRRPPVANLITYVMVIDEAHRVAQFKAIELMLREGRSKGLAVVLATQAPSDLPEVVDTNAQTRICFRLSDAVVAGQAARKLDPSDESLADRIRTLGTGEAFVSLEGRKPRWASPRIVEGFLLMVSVDLRGHAASVWVTCPGSLSASTCS